MQSRTAYDISLPEHQRSSVKRRGRSSTRFHAYCQKKLEPKIA